MTTYLSFLSWFLACRWDREENPDTTRAFDGMAQRISEPQADRIESIIWGN